MYPYLFKLRDIQRLRKVLYSVKGHGGGGRPVVVHTPTQFNERLSSKYSARVFLKREDLQTVRSFKIRGALARIMSLTIGERDKGVVCASAGNHAQGVALACSALGLRADIFVPVTTPMQKQHRIQHFGGENCVIHHHGRTFDECLARSLSFSEARNKPFIHPYNHADTVAGQATIAAEIVEDFGGAAGEERLDVVMGCVGGGGLMAGVGGFFKYFAGGGGRRGGERVEIIGAEPESCPSFGASLEGGEGSGPVMVSCSDQFVDGASVPQMGELTFDLCKDVVSSVESVSVGKICETMLELYQEDGIVVEPAGALSIAALDGVREKIKNKTIVCIVSGGNHDVMRYPEVVERSLVYQKLKHYYLIEFNQTPGELRRFVNEVLGPDDDITRFEYMQKTRKEFGTVLVGIQVKFVEDEWALRRRMGEHGFIFQRISARADWGDMVGGFVV